MPNDNNGAGDVFVRDTCVGAPAGCTPSTARVSLANDGSEGNGHNQQFAISGSGRLMAFVLLATNLAVNDTNQAFDVFVRDTCFGAPVGCTHSTIRVSVASDGTQGNAESRSSSISADGRFVAFDSASDNLVANDTNTHMDIFVHDTCTGAPAGCLPSTIRASLADDGSQSTDGIVPSISPDGRYVAFASSDNNLVPGDTNGVFNDLFLRDACLGVTTACTPSTIRVSVATDGTQGNSDSIISSISTGGRFVAFSSFASTLVAGDTNTAGDIFVRDTCIGVPAGCTPSTTRISVAGDGTQGTGGLGSTWLAISVDGRFTAFVSEAANLISNDTNGQRDIFLALN